MKVFTSARRAVLLGAPFKDGAEGWIYHVADQPDSAAKIYKERQGPPCAKLEQMLADPLRLPSAGREGPLIVWPTAILYDASGCCVGFTMPLVKQAHEIHLLYTPLLRGKHFPSLERRQLYQVAAGVACAFKLVHAHGYIVGDVNQRNILVDSQLRAVLIDTDSFQVGQYHCDKLVPEYTSPQLLGLSSRVDLTTIERCPAHDYFGLAVILFQLLHDGAHPFKGVWLGSGEPPPLEQRIQANLFPHALSPHGPVVPPPNLPSLDALGPQLRDLFVRCFVEGHADPERRPTAAEWEQALLQARRDLRRCADEPSHFYAPHLATCPYCRLAPAVPVKPGPSTRAQLRHLFDLILSHLSYLLQHAAYYQREIAQSVQLWGMWTLGSFGAGVLGAMIDSRSVLFVGAQGQPGFSVWTLLALGMGQWWALERRILGQRRWVLNLLVSLLVLNTAFRLAGPAVALLVLAVERTRVWALAAWPALAPAVVIIGSLSLVALLGLLTGVTLGSVQWLTLRRYCIRAKLWIPASTVAWLAASMTFAASGSTPLAMLVAGAISGLAAAVMFWRQNPGRMAAQRLPWSLGGVLINLVVGLAVLGNLISGVVVVRSPAVPAAVPTVTMTDLRPAPAARPPSLGSPAVPTTRSPDRRARISTSGGRNALLRERATTSARVLTRLPDSSPVVLLEGPVRADGMRWWRVRADAGEGWVAEPLLVADP